MNKIKDDDLLSAAGYALLEANKWSSVAKMITKKGYDKERACIQVLSIELYLKSILMCEGINIYESNNRKGHNAHYLYDLYNRMSDKTKTKLKQNINFVPIHDRDPLIDDKKYDFNIFEEALQGISNYFVDLRYEFDKFVNGQPIYVMCDFINEFEGAIKKLAKEIYLNHV